MIKRYLGKSIICCAEKQIKSGQEGFAITFADGYKTWVTDSAFYRTFREMAENEIDLIFTEGALQDK